MEEMVADLRVMHAGWWTHETVALGLARIVALYYRSARPLHTKLTNIQLYKVAISLKGQCDRTLGGC
jgi:hypothetical protein